MNNNVSLTYDKLKNDIGISIHLVRYLYQNACIRIYKFVIYFNLILTYTEVG